MSDLNGIARFLIGLAAYAGFVAVIVGWTPPSALVAVAAFWALASATWIDSKLDRHAEEADDE